MAAIAHPGANGCDRFIEPDRQAARQQMRRGGKTDGTAADHGDRKIVESRHVTPLLVLE
jgi:hypothetical protein